MTWNFLPYMEEIGKAYAEAQDASGDPSVVSAWTALGNDSRERAARLDGEYDIKVVQFEPYENAEQQDYDIRNYNHFLVSDQNSDHPIWDVDTNVAFRKVHDLMGHYPSFGDFSWEGENLACGEHFKLLSGEARTALFVECIMQTAAVNVYKKFLPQKCFIPANFDPETGYTPLGEAKEYSDKGKIYWNRGASLREAAYDRDMLPVIDTLYEAMSSGRGIDSAMRDASFALILASGDEWGLIEGNWSELYDIMNFFKDTLDTDLTAHHLKDLKSRILNEGKSWA